MDRQTTPTLQRRADGRLVAGVCRGLADQLDVDVLIIRIAFVLLITVGVGVLAYGALWLLVPRRAESAGGRDWVQVFAYGALLGGLGMISWTATVSGPPVWPVVLAGLGVAIAWQQADPERGRRWMRATSGRMRQTWLRTGLGAILVSVGIAGFLASSGELRNAREGLAAAAIILTGAGVIAAPWLIRLWTDLDRERRERIRSQERAEIAAHVHDSVLHTLTLIQRNPGDSKEVQRLARSQERELRAWLYAPRADPDETLAAAVATIAGEVEDAHGIPLEVVSVGDCALDERVGAALQAAREAMVNASKYSGAASISVFAEVEGQDVTIFVRDRGKGFDLESVSEDRLGVRQSIIGRMERNGGAADVRTSPGAGTEVRLQVKRQ